MPEPRPRSETVLIATRKVELELLNHALDLAVGAATSAVTDCSCESCKETRRQMRDFFLDEAKAMLTPETQERFERAEQEAERRVLGGPDA